VLSDVRDYYGLVRELGRTGFFETSQLQQVIKELKLAIKDGKLIALSGIVGTGKTATLQKIQDLLAQDKEILVAKSLSVDGAQTTLGTLILALFFDLANEKDFKIPTQPERRERALRDLVKKRNKPVALLVDDAHDLHSKTLLGLKRLIEVIRDGKGTLSVVLAGHPKLKNDMMRAPMEEIGARTTLFQAALRGDEPMSGQQRNLSQRRFDEFLAASRQQTVGTAVRPGQRGRVQSKHIRLTPTLER